MNQVHIQQTQTWCVLISVFDPVAPLLDAGTVRPLGWWWAQQATVQTSDQRNSAGHGQRPEPYTCTTVWDNCTEQLCTFIWRAVEINTLKTIRLLERIVNFVILLFSTPAVVHPVTQLQLKGAVGMSTVKDRHQTTQCVQVATQICNCRSKHS